MRARLFIELNLIKKCRLWPRGVLAPHCLWTVGPDSIPGALALAPPSGCAAQASIRSSPFASSETLAFARCFILLFAKVDSLRLPLVIFIVALLGFTSRVPCSS
jgi:hypothetical protein